MSEVGLRREGDVGVKLGCEGRVVGCLRLLSGEECGGHLLFKGSTTRCEKLAVR